MQPWSYLLTDELDFRVLPIAGYLARRVDNKIIVDLDCGHAPLLKYIPHTFEAYYGNDILYDRFPHVAGTQFYAMKDEEFVKTEFPRVDVLIVLGHGGFEISKEQLESATLTQSIKTMVEKYSPEIIVIEAVERFTSVHRNLMSFCKQKGYGIKQYAITHPIEDFHWLKSRVYFIAEK